MPSVENIRRFFRFGAIAQLGERLHGMQEVSGSIPLSSTKSNPNDLALKKRFQMWGYSSAGRALAWHARGQRFDPAYLHHYLTPDPSGSVSNNPKKSTKALPRAKKRATLLPPCLPTPLRFASPAAARESRACRRDPAAPPAHTPSRDRPASPPVRYRYLHTGDDSDRWRGRAASVRQLP